MGYYNRSVIVMWNKWPMTGKHDTLTCFWHNRLPNMYNLSVSFNTSLRGLLDRLRLNARSLTFLPVPPGIPERTRRSTGILYPYPYPWPSPLTRDPRFSIAAKFQRLKAVSSRKAQTVSTPSWFWHFWLCKLANLLHPGFQGVKCARDQPMLGPFPAPPPSQGKGPGDEVEIQLLRKFDKFDPN